MFGIGHNHVQITNMGINIEDVHDDDPPKFKRVYTKEIMNVVAKVTVYTSMFGARETSGELTQRGGRWVLFEPERVADKIIDRELSPLVQDFCDEVSKLDKEYMRSNPSEFTDTRGNTWRK